MDRLRFFALSAGALAAAAAAPAAVLAPLQQLHGELAVPLSRVLRPYLYVLCGRTPIAVWADDLVRWGEWFKTEDRRVALTRVGRYQVSTVFLGIDHNHACVGPPILFETMVFPGEDQWRCSTWDEAEAQHRGTVAELVRVTGETAEEVFDADDPMRGRKTSVG